MRKSDFNPDISAMWGRYGKVYHDPQAAESPGAGFPACEDFVAENARLRSINNDLEIKNKYDSIMIDRMFRALNLVVDYLEDRIDADCDQDGFIPNDEMKLKNSIEYALNGGNP